MILKKWKKYIRPMGHQNVSGVLLDVEEEWAYDQVEEKNHKTELVGKKRKIF